MKVKSKFDKGGNGVWMKIESKLDVWNLTFRPKHSRYWDVQCSIASGSTAQRKEQTSTQIVPGVKVPNWKLSVRISRSAWLISRFRGCERGCRIRWWDIPVDQIVTRTHRFATRAKIITPCIQIRCIALIWDSSFPLSHNVYTPWISVQIRSLAWIEETPKMISSNTSARTQQHTNTHQSLTNDSPVIDDRKWCFSWM